MCVCVWTWCHWSCKVISLSDCRRQCLTDAPHKTSLHIKCREEPAVMDCFVHFHFSLWLWWQMCPSLPLSAPPPSRSLSLSFFLCLSSGGDADGAAARGSADWRASRPAFQRQLPQPALVHPWHAPGALEEQAASRLPGVQGGPWGVAGAGSHSQSEEQCGDVMRLPGRVCQTLYQLLPRCLSLVSPWTLSYFKLAILRGGVCLGTSSVME